MEVHLLDSHKICNIYTSTPTSDPQLQKKCKNYNIQLWYLFPDKKFKRLSSEAISQGFYPYCIGKVGDKMYIIFRRGKLEYSVVGKFLEYYNSEYLDKNILILDKNILTEFKKYIQQPNEISGFLKYNPIFINSNFSWKYIHKIEDPNKFKLGTNDSADIIYDKITFHTHPIPTYRLKNVKVAWPSVDDYMGVSHIQSRQKITVYHIVVAMEGLYIITCKDSIPEKDIKNRMNVPYNLENIELFLKWINIVSPNIQTKFYDWKLIL